MRNILILCTGNICRSPMAQAELARLLPDRSVESAGLDALVGAPADPLAMAVAAEHGLDISMHRARQLSWAMCLQADLILAMEQHQIEELNARFPAVRGKAFLIGHYGNFEVPDPYRGPVASFEQAWGEISTGAEDWAARIARF